MQQDIHSMVSGTGQRASLGSLIQNQFSITSFLFYARCPPSGETMLSFSAPAIGQTAAAYMQRAACERHADTTTSKMEESVVEHE